MSPKAMPSKPAAKAPATKGKPAAAAAKADKKSAAAPAKGGKKAKGSEDEDGEEDEVAAARARENGDETPGVNAEAAEEAEEMEEENAARSSSSSSSDAAMAAASSSEMSASFKNFRHHPDMENFYRFIFDNDLRHEALVILNQLLLTRQEARAKAGTSSAKK